MVIGTLNSTPWQPSKAECDMSNTAPIEKTLLGEFAGMEMLTDVGAPESTLTMLLGQAAGFADVGAPQATLVMVTAYGLGLATLKYTDWGGAPG
jgi:hypothetical protein